MRLVALFAAAAALAACMTPVPTSGEGANPAPPPPAQASACGMEHWTYLIGRPESDIPRAELPAGARVICATCMATMDFRADRLNIRMSPDGRVGDVRCG